MKTPRWMVRIHVEAHEMPLWRALLWIVLALALIPWEFLILWLKGTG